MARAAECSRREGGKTQFDKFVGLDPFEVLSLDVGEWGKGGAVEELAGGAVAEGQPVERPRGLVAGSGAETAAGDGGHGDGVGVAGVKDTDTGDVGGCPTSGPSWRPPRRIQDQAHQQARQQRRHRDRDDPSKVDPRHQPQVDAPPVAVGQSDADRRSGYTLCLRLLAVRYGRGEAYRRHRQSQPRRHQDRHGAAQLHAEPARRRHQRQPVPQVAHEMVPHPRRHRHLLLNLPTPPDKIRRRKRGDRIRDVVGPVHERRRCRREDLQRAVHVLGAVIVPRRPRVHVLNIPAQDGLPLLRLDDVLFEPVAQHALDAPPYHRPAGPGSDRARRDAFDWRCARTFEALGVIVARGLDGLQETLRRAEALEFFLRQVAAVVVFYVEAAAARGRWAGERAREEERAAPGIVPFQLPVFVHDAAPEVREEEEDLQECNARCDRDHRDGDLHPAQLDVKLDPLPDNEHGQPPDRNEGVDRNGEESAMHGVSARKNEMLRDQEHNRPQRPRNPRRDPPRRKDLRNAMPAPVDIPDSDRGRPRPDEAADDGMRCADGQAAARRDGQEDGGPDDGAHHGEHEDGGLGVVQVRVDDALADGLGDARAHADGPGQLHAGGDQERLFEG
ncbi:uncharacterized protein DSM5745_06919 [Aspergillus mulundensis]|uniref:Uncharacterized protein n=1 Tax=Aspergillus mulundensis TaxID=1810919 RepID=A0A3D8RJN4_9EURO|nr:hypothetical protein DSM5745_06919 [Aspergillus mulundensis]RDW74257.1 hypothetical protein DSM5745_06919 [Aspergillus mulundensis]